MVIICIVIGITGCRISFCVWIRRRNLFNLKIINWFLIRNLGPY
uniref:Uncharacterized protein n=1 Tax=Rhizophora mucronata TaxID=61149 RepID=A0A2P2PET3_RHIMU